MNSIEVTGENVEEAIEKGLAKLGVGPGDVIVEVLEEPSRGMFGIGARPAKVRLQVLIVRGAPPEVAAPAPPTVPDPKPASVAEVETPEVDYASDFAEEEDDAVDFAAGETTEEDATIGREVLLELLENIGVTAAVNIRRTEPSRPGESTPWLLDVSGDDMSVLIGRRGETLAALQYITRLISSRRLQRRANIIVDVAGYKSRRSKQLRQLAVRMADQAIQQGRMVTLEPMPPNERRIIHMTLRTRADVTTKSVGEGDSRKVTIVPQ